jgi:mono/diheme cytochrome c family protein
MTMAATLRAIITALLTAIPTVMLTGTLAACGGEPAPSRDATAKAFRPGEELYQRCAVCHMLTGEGMKPAYRSLVGSVWATGPADRAIALMLHGIRGPIRDGGVTYAMDMLPYGTGTALTDAEVADVLTYVRTSWGNHASPITREQVARVRAATAGRTAPYSAAELALMQ